MNNLYDLLENYLNFCNSQKTLNNKTIYAYRTDLKQFFQASETDTLEQISPKTIEFYIAFLHSTYKPRTVKRKIASIKAFYRFLVYRNIIPENPFDKIFTKFREPMVLPRTIPLHTIKTLLKEAYAHRTTCHSPYAYKFATRDIAVLEMLFATGMRISELCNLQLNDLNLYDGIILIHGKGSKERVIQLCDSSIISLLLEYHSLFHSTTTTADYFLIIFS